MPQPNPATPALEHLSLEQKAALLSGRDFWSTQPIDAAGVPSIVLTDGPHGVRRQAGQFDRLRLHDAMPATCFPAAVAVGSSWDPAVAERVGAAVGREARALGVHVALGPGVNIKRSPLCGRNFEYYSEDPLLAGLLGAAHVQGQQGQGVGASVKHFAANNQETDRMLVSADADERTLREIYLPAFEHIVTQAKPATVMCAYNKVNGVYAAHNRWLLTEVLREEWGFTGAVVSDWGAVHDPVAALAAGLDLEMPGTGGLSAQRIVGAVRAGELDEAAVDAAAGRVLALARLAAGPASGFDADVHHALARQLACDCAVLLKNDGGALPLTGSGPIAVVGEFARTPGYRAAEAPVSTPPGSTLPWTLSARWPRCRPGGRLRPRLRRGQHGRQYGRRQQRPSGAARGGGDGRPADRGHGDFRRAGGAGGVRRVRPGDPRPAGRAGQPHPRRRRGQPAYRRRAVPWRRGLAGRLA